MVACMILCTGTVLAADWYYVGSSNDGSVSVFIDNSSVEKNYQHASILEKHTMSDGSFSIFKVFYTHTPKTYTMLSFTDYNADGSVENSHVLSKYELNTNPIVPDSVGEAVWYCIWSK